MEVVTFRLRGFMLQYMESVKMAGVNSTVPRDAVLVY